MVWLAEGRGSCDPFEPVVPLCEQLRTQHKRAVEASGVRFSVWAAFLQQSMPAIPGMLHSCSLEYRGMPAKTLPPITKRSASDAMRVTMPLTIYGRHPILSRTASFGAASFGVLAAPGQWLLQNKALMSPIKEGKGVLVVQVQ